MAEAPASARAAPPPADEWWARLESDVVEAGLCTQCGTCVGLAGGALAFRDRDGVPRPVRAGPGAVPRAAYDGCPARWCHYPELNRFVFGRLPASWLSGVVERSFVGHAADEAVRRAGASGGVISAVLVHLLETGRIAGAVCLELGRTVPYRAEPVIARTREDVLRCAQSVYSVTPVNTVLDALGEAAGPLAYVGLPDQVASIRKLQRLGHPAVRGIEFVIGPYMGTQMYFEAVRSFLRSHGVRSEQEIARLAYRAGEWPGHLEVRLRDGRVIRAAKFHYNYLIPFFVTRSSLQLVDFTNELTDVSVGDAWSPRYEARRGGYSVVLARSPRGLALLEEMRAAGRLALEEVPLAEVLDMHGHMLDFKKRGSFIRTGWRRPRPDYGYAPGRIAPARRLVEWCLRGFFALGRLPAARWAVEHLPLAVVGPVFDALRRAWKAVSRPTKRRGLRERPFVVDDAPPGRAATPAGAAGRGA